MNNMIDDTVLSLVKSLIKKESVTPNDAGCQDILIDRLSALGFEIEEMVFEDTRNLWARKGKTAPLFAFAGHTDVVPAGSAKEWKTRPFEPSLIDGYLYGRGAADMKSSLACMLIAVERFLQDNPDYQGSIAFLITSDEEGPFINGTTKVVDTLIARDEKIDMCIVGEPSSTKELGDVIKNGRRGSLSGSLVVLGTQGHVAYPHLAENAILHALPALLELSSIIWDEGNEFFPPTSFQIVNLQSGVGVSNVIPGECHVQFNFRFSSELTEKAIKARVQQILDSYSFKYSMDWSLSGEPFLTSKGSLLDAVVDSVYKVTQKKPKCLTTGGTSDGRFIAKMGTEVIELGPVNSSIHKVNECVKVSDLALLTKMYQNVLEQLLV